MTFAFGVPLAVNQEVTRPPSHVCILHRPFMSRSWDAPEKNSFASHYFLAGTALAFL